MTASPHETQHHQGSNPDLVYIEKNWWEDILITNSDSHNHRAVTSLALGGIDFHLYNSFWRICKIPLQLIFLKTFSFLSPSLPSSLSPSLPSFAKHQDAQQCKWCAVQRLICSDWHLVYFLEVNISFQRWVLAGKYFWASGMKHKCEAAKTSRKD